MTPDTYDDGHALYEAGDHLLALADAAARVRPVEAAKRDEEIVAAHVKPPEVLDGAVTLVEYDPAWRALYAREGKRASAPR